MEIAEGNPCVMHRAVAHLVSPGAATQEHAAPNSVRSLTSIIIAKQMIRPLDKQESRGGAYAISAARRGWAQ